MKIVGTAAAPNGKAPAVPPTGIDDATNLIIGLLLVLGLVMTLAVAIFFAWVIFRDGKR